MLPKFSRRAVLSQGLAATLATSVAGRALASSDENVRNNLSSFVMQNWRDHFDSLGKGAIVADTVSRALHFWSADGADYRVFPWWIRTVTYLAPSTQVWLFCGLYLGCFVLLSTAAALRANPGPEAADSSSPAQARRWVMIFAQSRSLTTSSPGS